MSISRRRGMGGRSARRTWPHRRGCGPARDGAGVEDVLSVFEDTSRYHVKKDDGKARRRRITIIDICAARIWVVMHGWLAAAHTRCKVHVEWCCRRRVNPRRCHWARGGWQTQETS